MQKLENHKTNHKTTPPPPPKPGDVTESLFFVRFLGFLEVFCVFGKL